MFNQCSMQLLLLAHFSFITGVCIFWRIKGCKVSHLSLQDHPSNVIQLCSVRCRQIHLQFSGSCPKWHRMMHSSAQELWKESWLAQTSHICTGSTIFFYVTLQKCLPSWGSTVLLPAHMLLALPAAKWEKAVHRSPIPTVTGVADSDCLFVWLKLCKPANHAAPQGTSALPCVRVLTEGPPFEPKIYFRNEHGDSS